MVGEAYTHLDDMLASQYQSIDWTQHTSYQSRKESVGGTFLAPVTMHEKTSHETSLDLDSCFDEIRPNDAIRYTGSDLIST